MSKQVAQQRSMSILLEDEKKLMAEKVELEQALAAAKQRIEKLENRVDDLAMKVMTAQSLMTEKQLYEYDELVRQRRQESIADLAPAKNAALGGQESE